MPTMASLRRSGRFSPGPAGSGVGPTSLRDLLATVAALQAALELRPWYVPSWMCRIGTSSRLSANASPRHWLGSCLKAATPAVSCRPPGTSAKEPQRQLWSTNPQGALAPGDPPAHGCGGYHPGSSCEQPPSGIVGAARSTMAWATECCSMSREALSKVRAARVPDADHGTEHALAASLAARGSRADHAVATTPLLRM